MPVSGLVVTLSNERSAARDALDWLESDARFEIGPPTPDNDRRISLALDTPDEGANRECWSALQSHAGIDFVDVVCVFFS